jgi:hypothetical protein
MAHSKKDYVAIAAIIASEQEPVMPQDISSEDIAVHQALENKRFLVARRFADYFERNNPRFNRERFLTACGVQS